MITSSSFALIEILCSSLVVNAVDTDGTINGRDPLDAITLSDPQDWPGSVTFSQLEVTEELQVICSVFSCFFQYLRFVRYS